MHEKRRISFTRRKAQFQDYHVLCSKLTRSVVYKILPVQEARSSWEPQNDAKSYLETCSNIVDYRIPGISLSTVKQQDVKRQNKVKKLIEMFERHLHKQQFLQDLSQTQKINRFQRRIAENTCRYEPHRDLRTLGKFC